eukprot:SAG22_NODE_16858_length_316_cov_0.737327_1_plen_34_part_01
MQQHQPTADTPAVGNTKKIPLAIAMLEPTHTCAT